MTNNFPLARAYREELRRLFLEQGFAFKSSGTNIHISISNGFSLFIVVRSEDDDALPGDLRIELKYGKTNKLHQKICNIFERKKDKRRYEFSDTREKENFIYIPLMDITELNKTKSVIPCWKLVKKSIQFLIEDFGSEIEGLSEFIKLK
ncbi:hypothetical protein [Nitratidesulfovibrio sp. 1201_IL3209]|uniref:hypothetical protein n=1 Tax=Nitratidesulfovibrio sp. 1201_IL3209 TaxID=3084053 RepID=UPI002FD88025